MKQIIIKSGMILFFGLILISCNDKKWKETVSTEIHAESVNTTISYGANELVIDTIIVNIESTTVNGSRLQAENILLSNNEHQQLILTSNGSEYVGSYSVPQGTYESFQLTTKFGGGSSGSIILKGNYNHVGGNDKVVRLELDYNEYMLQDLVENSGNPISIDKGNPGTIKLRFDPEILFDNLNPSYWNSANTSNINGSNGILVTNGSNSNLYNQVTPKISESLSFSFEL